MRDVKYIGKKITSAPLAFTIQARCRTVIK